MELSLGMITIVVDDYDKAISHYVGDLGFQLLEDTVLTEEKRWVVVSPGEGGAKLLLACASTPAQELAIGNATGGRVGFFLNTSDFQATFEKYKRNGVTFTEDPRSEKYGQVVVFKDLYGNKWDLIGPRK